jgi:hypothetical protein
MVSNVVIRKREADARQKRRARAAECLAAVIALSQSLLPRTLVVIYVVCMAMTTLLIYALLQLPWTREASLPLARATRIIVGVVCICALVGGYGYFVWPPRHRHSLSEKEKAAFEKPLRWLNQPQMSVHLYCAPYDEVDCVYAAELIPLFGEAGWDVSTMVERITLGRPKPGIVIGLHGTVKPEDEPKLKWNEGEWTKVTPEEEVVRQAFVNIGIEPDSTSGAIVPENQINIYVGHERENESDPTDMTQMFRNLDRARRENPKIHQSPGAKGSPNAMQGPAGGCPRCLAFGHLGEH